MSNLRRKLDDEARWARARADYYARTGVDINTMPEREAAEAIKDIYPLGSHYQAPAEIVRVTAERLLK